MKREIKFKAKSIYNGEWVYGDLLHKTDGTHIYVGKGKGGHTLCTRIDPSTVCQFTGMKDENGNEIWEGDIVHDSYALLGIDNLYEVVYIEKEGMFAFKNLDKVNNYEPFVNLLEAYIVGNKFDKEKNWYEEAQDDYVAENNIKLED